MPTHPAQRKEVFGPWPMFSLSAPTGEHGKLAAAHKSNLYESGIKYRVVNEIKAL